MPTTERVCTEDTTETMTVTTGFFTCYIGQHCRVTAATSTVVVAVTAAASASTIAVVVSAVAEGEGGRRVRVGGGGERPCLSKRPIQ